METVSWEDCQEFCAKTELALPTEAQWEYACRAGRDGRFSGTGELADMGWYSENSGAEPHPAGEKQPNDFGLHDTHGNVWEWCEDVWDGDFYERPEASGRNPVRRGGSENRVLRGGGWDYSATYCRSACRDSDHWSVPFLSFGFRPAVRLP